LLLFGEFFWKFTSVVVMGRSIFVEKYSINQ
jgi:hypothetical protein